MSRRRLLIIEDQDDIRDAAVIALEMTAGWEVAAARTGREGVEKARAIGPDAILLDIFMPDIDGLRTLEELRSDRRTARIPVVLLTAGSGLADRGRFEELGVSGLIPKPFDPLALARQVMETLEWRE